MSFIRRHKGAVVWSLALHVAVAAAVVVGLPWRIERPRVPVGVSTPIIEGTIIDTAAIEREKVAREAAARAERQRQQQEDRRRREAAEQQRLAEQREVQRVAAERRAREDAQRKEEERIAAERAEQRRREEQAKAEREAQEKREREEAEKRAQQQAEQRRRQQAEAELAQQLAREAEANAARAAGLLDQYILMIENKIKQHWNRPLSARAGLDCVVRVVQLPTGDVVSATVATCNGDEAVRRSIERAVMDASPLPKPPNPALFERNLNVNFRPEE
jgi:colicin import membrane protein